MFFLQIRKDLQRVPVTLFDTSGVLLTGLTGPTIQITKNGASYVTPNLGSWTEIGFGDYYVTLDDADTDTPGWMILRVKGSASAEAKVCCEISIDAAERAAMAERIRVFRRGEFQ